MAAIMAIGFAYLLSGARAGVAAGSTSLCLQYLTGKPVFGEVGKYVGAVPFAGGILYALIKPKKLLNESGDDYTVRRLIRYTASGRLVAFGGTCLFVIFAVPMGIKFAGRLSKHVSTNFEKIHHKD